VKRIVKWADTGHGAKLLRISDLGMRELVN
jgi:hypothetical protein